MRKLKLDHHRVFVTDKYISDGRVLIVKSECRAMLSKQSDLKPYWDAMPGSYSGKVRESEHLPDIELVVRNASREGQERLSAETQTCVPIRGGAGMAARITGSTFASYINCDFWPLYELGAAFAIDKRSAIAIRDNNGTLMAIIMPMRLDHKLDLIEFPVKEKLAGAQ